ncbi:restriction endonuclease subunit S [Deinococcus planocerae]|uniref:restriction endonuclease subunit S n=1 Tax=Deinococcus planocerae TaxID=1737569 RepID=UPI0011AF6907|nr:restriction endonuclease subunit S [Deinococcus planocerae]
MPLSDLFHVVYGVNLELNRMTPDPAGVAFVGRSDRNNGVTGRVAAVPGIAPLPAGTLTVAGGGSVMAAFVQPEPYYSGRDLYYLTAKVPMTLRQKLYYCACITANRYRFSYGRQANRTIRTLRLPALAALPAWLDSAGDQPLEKLETTLDTLESTLA